MLLRCCFAAFALLASDSATATHNCITAHSHNTQTLHNNNSEMLRASREKHRLTLIAHILPLYAHRLKIHQLLSAQSRAFGINAWQLHSSADFFSMNISITSHSLDFDAIWKLLGNSSPHSLHKQLSLLIIDYSIALSSASASLSASLHYLAGIIAVLSRISRTCLFLSEYADSHETNQCNKQIQD